MQKVVISGKGKTFILRFNHDLFSILHNGLELINCERTVDAVIPCDCPDVFIKTSGGIFLYGTCVTKTASKIELYLFTNRIINGVRLKKNEKLSPNKIKEECAKNQAHEYRHFQDAHQQPLWTRKLSAALGRIIPAWAAPFLEIGLLFGLVGYVLFDTIGRYGIVMLELLLVAVLATLLISKKNILKELEKFRSIIFGLDSESVADDFVKTLEKSDEFIRWCSLFEISEIE